jgi:papain like cysteine protease AvrRpt2
MPFTIQTQLMDLWCWAAVAASIDAYLTTGAPREQCTIANALTPGVECCPKKQECNQAQPLDSALGAVGRFLDMFDFPLAFEDLQRELDANFPVCARIGWLGPDGGGHFVVIAGYSIAPSGARMLKIRDPWYIDSTMEYSDFAEAYQAGRGEWTHSYRVKE